LLEALYGQLQLLQAGEEALGYAARVRRDVHAFLAVETGGGVASERVLELFAAGAAGAETGDGLGFEFCCVSLSGHWFHCRLFSYFVVQKSRAPHFGTVSTWLRQDSGMAYP
jgi:hypothetical protein